MGAIEDHTENFMQASRGTNAYQTGRRLAAVLSDPAMKTLLLERFSERWNRQTDFLQGLQDGGISEQQLAQMLANLANGGYVNTSAFCQFLLEAVNPDERLDRAVEESRRFHAAEISGTNPG
jgi:hypothetical protein